VNAVDSLPIVDARHLDEARRAALKPGELVRDDAGQERRLPCLFYEVASWSLARETELAPNFGVWEFIDVDLHEAPALRAYPRYVPCTAVLLACALSTLRQQVKQPLWISANGGYRSPSHARTRAGSPHCWGSAANIYRVGDDWLDTQSAIERVAAAAVKAVPAFWPRPFGDAPGTADDHLHLDLGYSIFVPRDAPGA
jgi:hypothetical protein